MGNEPTTNAPETNVLGTRIAIASARAIDHLGLTVPNLEQALAFFTELFGAAILWQSPPFSSDGRSPKAPPGINADPRATVRLAMLRFGPNLNVELIEFRIPDQTQCMPLSSNLNVGHMALAVDDIDAAGAYLREKGIELLEGPQHDAEGPTAGQSFWYFLTPWGMPVELVYRPATMPYERDTTARLFKEELEQGGLKNG